MKIKEKKKKNEGRTGVVTKVTKMSGYVFLLHQFKVLPRASLEEPKSKAEMFTREDGTNINTLFIATLSLFLIMPFTHPLDL